MLLSTEEAENSPSYTVDLNTKAVDATSILYIYIYNGGIFPTQPDPPLPLQACLLSDHQQINMDDNEIFLLSQVPQLIARSPLSSRQ